MSFNPSIFRKYDIRGVYPRDLDQERVFKIVSAFAKIFPKIQKIVVARDSRKSGPSLKKSVIRALTEQGKEVIDIGLAPDSLFSFSIFHYDFDGGVMVTASHNPPQYNGLILNVKGKEITEQKLEKIKELSQGFQGRALEFKTASLDPCQDYINYVIKKINLKRPLKIVFDTGNGAVDFLPEKVFKKLGCETKTIFGKPDGNFPNHLPDPYLEKNLKDIKKEVLKQKADLGLAFDGDGDRVVLIDNKGRRVLEDYCLLLLAKEVLKKHKGPVVHDMRVSKVFLDEMEKQGVKTYFSACHHNAVIEKIEEVGAVFGGEITTHYFFPKDYFLADDALFSALRLAEIVSQHKNFADFIDTLPKVYATPEIFIKVSDKEKFALIEKIKTHLKEKGYQFIDIDGARIEFEKGWALIRASNTSPLIKIRIEGQDSKSLKKIKSKTSQILAQVTQPRRLSKGI